jgi:hypothetical protein
VSYKDFIEELDNTTSECNLLTFLCKTDVNDFYPKYRVDKIKIPAGNSCGLTDSTCGGGSLISMTLLRDFEVDIRIPHDDSDCDRWDFRIDGTGSIYSLHNIY